MLLVGVRTGRRKVWGRISVQCLSLSTVARYNRTSYFYPTFSESSEHSHLLVSPVLVASAVIGVVIILSCITIIVGSIRRDRQARPQRQPDEQHLILY